jgi:hypothetical protein
MAESRPAILKLILIDRIELKSLPRFVVVGLATLAAVGFASAAAAGLGMGNGPAVGNNDSLVEDFSYPNAEEILAKTNVKLISGDGNIEIADCKEPPSGDIGLIKVYTSDVAINEKGLVCFRAAGKTGLLTMEVPGVFEIRGDGQRPGTGHDITAIIKPEGGEQLPPIKVDPDGSTQVGIGTDPPGPPATLLQLRVTG